MSTPNLVLPSAEETTWISPARRAGAKVPTRRTAELWLVIFAWALGAGAFWLTHLGRDGHWPSDWWQGPLLWGLLAIGAHLIVRWRTPYADPVILPCVIALSGLGLAMLHRLDLAQGSHVATTQLLWMALGVVAFGAVLVWLRDYRVLQRFPYLLFIVGLVLLLLPLLPGIGWSVNGSQIWIKVFNYSFQPAEVAKIVLTLAFASYLADRSEVLQTAGRKLGPWTLPRLRDVVPVFVMWAAGVVVLIFQNDLGTALLFFGLFVMMLYVATSRPGWVVAGLIAFTGAAWLAYRYVPHVSGRVDAWLHPFSDIARNGQIVEGQFGLAWGGLFGRGWGMGSPWRVPLATTDFISAAIGEELGLVGLVAVILLYWLVVARGLKTALLARDSFGKLLTAGLSFVIVLQVTAIIGGVTRLLPLTGLTTPFLSRGGSSLLANWVVVALLLVVSHQARRPVATFEPFVDLDAEQTAVIDLGALLEGGIGPRVAAPSVPAPAGETVQREISENPEYPGHEPEYREYPEYKDEGSA